MTTGDGRTVHTWDGRTVHTGDGWTVPVLSAPVTSDFQNLLFIKTVLCQFLLLRQNFLS